MEEIQIKKDFCGSGAFRLFYEWLIPQLPSDILFVEAFVNIENCQQFHRRVSVSCEERTK